MDANKNIAATFTATQATQFTLTTNVVGSGSVSSVPAGSIYNENDVVSLTATPAAGFEFSGWSGDLTGITNPASITMDGNKTVTATFTEVQVVQFTLTTNVIGSGSVTPSPAGGIYTEATIVTLTATPAVGFEFSGWSGDLSGAINPSTITMDANKSVTATFTEIQVTQYTLTATVVGSGTVTPSPAGGIYDENTVVYADRDGIRWF